MFQIKHKVFNEQGMAADRELIPWSVNAREVPVPTDDWRIDEARTEGMEVRHFVIESVNELPDIEKEWASIYAYELPRSVGDSILIQGKDGNYDVLDIEGAGACTVEVILL